VNVVLDLKAEDDPTTDEHLPFDGEMLDPMSTSSGVVEMLVSNRADFEAAVWQPYQNTLPWILEPNAHGRAHVFAKYRDAAGNDSDVVALSIDLPEPTGALPWCIGLLVGLGRLRGRRSASARRGPQLPE